MNNLEFWKKFHQPPASALKAIGAGRLKGKSDINPQWRYHALTEAFGPCGIGWKYSIDRLWTEPASNDQVFAFANVTLFIKRNGEWSDAIPANGGSMLIAKESNGMFSCDEAYKMAITDAIGTAAKMLGVAADIYLGNWDGTNYIRNSVPEPEPEFNPDPAIADAINEATSKEVLDTIWKTVLNTPELRKAYKPMWVEAATKLKGANNA